MLLVKKVQIYMINKLLPERQKKPPKLTLNRVENGNFNCET